MAKVYMFLAEGFEEMEALTSVDVLRRVDVNIEMISVTGSLNVVGGHGINVLADKLISDIDDKDVDMLILPGGLPNAETLSLDDRVKDMVVEQNRSGKFVAAICAAPMALGKWGLLAQKRATCYPGFDTYLEGATYTSRLTETDGNIITGKGPGAALPFAFEVAKALVGEEKVTLLKEQMCIS